MKQNLPVSNGLTQTAAADCCTPKLLEVNTSSVMYPSWSAEQLSRFQHNDPVLGIVWELWHQNWTHRQRIPEHVQISPDIKVELKLWLREWSKLVVNKGVLCRKMNDIVSGNFFQVLTPKILIPKILLAAHDEWGHQGITKTTEIVRKRCFWPRLNRTITDMVNQCSSCILAKAPVNEGRTPMRHLLAGKPLELLAMDFVKIDKGKGGYENVLVFTDAFTKFAQAVPCKDQSATTVARVLRDNWFTRFGVPVRLHSDQGRNVESEVIRELL